MTMNLQESSRQLIERHRTLLKEEYSRILPPGCPYALVDFPDHSNVGDSAIWVGERRLLKAITGRDPSYVSTIRSFDPDVVKKLPRDCPILIHGGGNLGDLWIKHQEFRELLLMAGFNRPIVQLPQSIRFGDADRAKRFADIVKGREDFTLLVRDRKSLTSAKDRLGISARLVPDSAVGIGPRHEAKTPEYDAVMLLRTDHEGAIDDDCANTVPQNTLARDWLEEPDDFASRTFKDNRRHALKKLRLGTQQRRLMFYDLLAERRVERGLALLSKGRVTVTDRLHGHILSVLLGLPTVSLDNSYGKVSTYIDAWTSDYAGLRRADDIPQAMQALPGLLSETSASA
ncbi:MAG: polysaccharide pyruvyl transferase family protein [Pacificimonas sp.]